MDIKCEALRPFLFENRVLKVGEEFITRKGHALDLVNTHLAVYVDGTALEEREDEHQSQAVKEPPTSRAGRSGRGRKPSTNTDSSN